MLNDFLDRCIWAADLSDEQRQRVRQAMFVREYNPGDYVCHKGEMAEHWLGVLEGIVKITTVSPSGKSVTFTGVPTGGWFGEGAALKQEIRKYDVMALRHSRIAFLPRETFQWLLDTSLPFTRFLLTQLNERLGQFIAAVEYERLLDIDSRVARAVSSLFNEHLYPGIGTKLEISQEEIGLLAGISRQRANQALKVLEQQGLVRVDYGEIEVLDLEGLRQYGE
ncbi:cAMP-binding domain of CRP or a regulatory subunit of cAMP-dependent protein kinases [Cupriavidus sp. H18C1]|uniref:Crp/Fnr family transcriptional regulator n=1 Tax=Cupriavidus cauae TaxID=2608999 RepID=A0A5M8AGU8_9BURK|nr:MULTISPECIES: Crp/Fnr family transcriptional regulator [Cupriavidus]ESH95863.1 Crp/Fnr family transcriptional regulator [Cupriavidus sp. HPC(L)]KAA0181455.1 Crp/Fnr family transcriptional regulator [Cupriavidus gilardii]KAA6120104.1 Crp/Fnr family transcriptional regulator [Cupriavidus cauae]MCA7085116.1 Crp/Fnr family transcriptional regulator [Cupriavidus sp. DB3]MCD9123935.1 Crp/Fnr family transcriptional regulator [Cupriavidus sp. UGS-1]